MPEAVRQLVLEGPRHLVVARRPVAAGAAAVRLRPAAVGLCGSDVHGFAGTSARRAPGTVMGHEIAARVEDPASALDGRLVVVDPVVGCGTCADCREGRAGRCRARRLVGCVPELPGGFADLLPAPAANLVPVADGLDPAVAALTEPLAVGRHAVALAAVAGRDVLVLGGGPIGLGAALAAQAAGAGRVRVSETHAHRRAALAALGLEAVPPGTPLPAPPDVVLECVGRPATVAEALAAVRPGGTVVAVGLAEPAWRIDAAGLVMEERVLRGSAVYTREEFRATAAWVEEHAARLAHVVQRRVSLDELPATFAEHAAGRVDAVKTVMVGPGAGAT